MQVKRTYMRKFQSWLAIVVAASVAVTAGATARERGRTAKARNADRCEDSEKVIRKTFEEFVSASRSCGVDADCGVALGRCPLPCGVVVARAKVTETESLAERLVSTLRLDCQCKYKCGPPAAAECRDKVCVERRDSRGTAPSNKPMKRTMSPQ
jgi:hypothetical protein